MPAVEAAIMITHGVKIVKDRLRGVTDGLILHVLPQVEAFNWEVH
jgi:hypothetical protein